MLGQEGTGLGKALIILVEHDMPLMENKRRASL
jgi:hypothetical protein